MGTIGEPSNLLPPLSSDSASSEVSKFLFVSLLQYDKDLNLVPYAAESYEVLDGGLTLRFILRKGIYWEDGVEMTAEDVAYTYRMMIDPKTPTAYGGAFRMISSLETPDRYTVIVRYDKPFARALVTWASAIMPRHLLEGTDLTQTPYAHKPVGNGPFRFKAWERGTRVTLTANPGYFRGRPYLDGLVFQIIPDLTTMFLELKAGSVDLMGLTPQQYIYQTESPEIRDAFNKFRYLNYSYTYLGYNLERPLFRDKRVRQALAHIIDKKEVITGALLGQGVPVNAPYVPTSWVYNTDIKPYEVDLDKARDLLAKAGWRQDSRGVMRNARGEPFRFTILTNQGNEQRMKAAVIIQSQLARVGIEARVRTVEWAVFLSRFLHPGRYDAVVMAWTTPLDPDLFDVWHSSRIEPPGLNFMRYRNAEVDELVVKARETFDLQARKAMYDRVQEILHEEQPYCFLYVPYSLPIVQKRFRGVEIAPAGLDWNIDTWWVPPAQQRYSLGQ